MNGGRGGRQVGGVDGRDPARPAPRLGSHPTAVRTDPGADDGEDPDRNGDREDADRPFRRPGPRWTGPTRVVRAVRATGTIRGTTASAPARTAVSTPTATIGTGADRARGSVDRFLGGLHGRNGHGIRYKPTCRRRFGVYTVRDPTVGMTTSEPGYLPLRLLCVSAAGMVAFLSAAVVARDPRVAVTAALVGGGIGYAASNAVVDYATDGAKR